MSEKAPLQNRLDKRDRERRSGVELERSELDSQMFGSEYYGDEIELKRKKVGVVADKVLPGVNGSRRERFAALDFIAFSVLLRRVMPRTAGVRGCFRDLYWNRRPDRTMIRSHQPRGNRYGRYRKSKGCGERLQNVELVHRKEETFNVV